MMTISYYTKLSDGVSEVSGLLALGFVEGCQHSPDHLCGVMLCPFHFGVQFYKVLGAIHRHIVLVICQTGEDIL